MKVLLLDNHDSFTYNVRELLRKIGCDTTVLTTDKLEDITTSSFDKLILSPGPGLPSESSVMDQVINYYKASKSILGICLGHQAIAIHFGAELVNLPEVFHGQSHRLQVNNSAKLFANLPTNFWVGLYHSWAVTRDSIPDTLRVTALSEKGIVMAIEHKHFDLHGIQFHPESHISEYGRELVKNFLEL